MTAEHWTFSTIGVVRSPFPEKFGVPRQSGLHSLPGIIELFPPYHTADCVRGLEQFSHLWISFIFHKNLSQGWNALVRPPRLGGNEKIGVFASRSPFRPNALGLSAVKLEKIIVTRNKTSLFIRGGDFVDGTPVVDIKPYIVYSDAHNTARSGYAERPPAKSLKVLFASTALDDLRALPEDHPLMTVVKSFDSATALESAENFIRETLTLDPRPAYSKDGNKHYYLRLFDLEITWQVEEEVLTVTRVVKTNG